MRRIVNRKLLDSYQGIKCLICNTTETTVGHHIKTRGAGGDDAVFNIVPLCVHHHYEAHKSLADFAFKYKQMEIFLLEHGWVCVGESRKWIRPKASS